MESHPFDLTEKVKNLTSKLTCLICNDIYKLASTVSECGHTFCDDCIQEHLLNNSTCFNCDCIAIPMNIKSNPPIRNLVDLLHELRTLGSQTDVPARITSKLLNINLETIHSEPNSPILSPTIENSAENYQEVSMDITQLTDTPVKTPSKLDLSHNPSPIRLVLSQMSPVNGSLSKKYLSNSQQTVITSTQSQTQQSSNSNPKQDFLESLDKDLLSNAPFTSTQQHPSPSGDRNASIDPEAFLPNSQEFSMIQSQNVVPIDIELEENFDLLDFSRNEIDMVMCTQNTQTTGKHSQSKNQTNENKDCADSTFDGIEGPGMLEISFDHMEDISIDPSRIQEPIKVNSLSLTTPDPLDQFHYVEIPSNSQNNQHKDEDSNNEPTMLLDSLELTSAKLLESNQVESSCTETKPNTKTAKPRKSSSKEPSKKKFKPEQLPDTNSKALQKLKSKNIDSPTPKSKIITPKNSKAMLTPDSDTSEWSCIKCTLLNNSKRRKCKVCNNPRYPMLKAANGKKNIRSMSSEADSTVANDSSPVKKMAKSKFTTKTLKQISSQLSGLVCSNPEYSIKPKPWKRVYLATTGLNDELKGRLSQDIIYLKAIGVNISLTTSKPYDSKTTHLIGYYNGLEQACIRSSKYLFGLLMSHKILSYDWIIQSIQAGGLLEEEPFITRGDSAIYPCTGPQLAFGRPVGENFALFLGVEFYFEGKFDSGGADKIELRNLAKMGKGRVTPKPPTRVHGVNDDMKLVIVRDKIINSTISTLTDNIFVRDKKWFLDCISKGEVDLS